jgi:hypothetical protein
MHVSTPPGRWSNAMSESARPHFSFVANDQQGRAHVIDVKLGESGREFWTEDGKRVTRARKGQYRIAETNIELTSDDPEAI